MLLLRQDIALAYGTGSGCFAISTEPFSKPVAGTVSPQTKIMLWVVPLRFRDFEAEAITPFVRNSSEVLFRVGSFRKQD